MHDIDLYLSRLSPVELVMLGMLDGPPLPAKAMKMIQEAKKMMIAAENKLIAAEGLLRASVDTKEKLKEIREAMEACLRETREAQ